MSKSLLSISAVATVICFVTSLFVFGCSEVASEKHTKSDTVKPLDHQDSPEKTVKISENFNKNCEEFTKAFPNTFQELDDLYGFDDQKGVGRVLYSKYAEHIPYFFNCAEIKVPEKMVKVVNIGSNGKWDADAIALFQDLAFSFIKSNSNDAVRTFDEVPDDKASSFWYFLFDGPHPNNKENLEKRKFLVELFGAKSKQSRLIFIQYRKVLETAD